MVDVRVAGEADAEVSDRLGAEAFGYPRPETPSTPSGPSQTTFVAEMDGRVVGKLRDRFYDSWWGGATLSTAGVASVCTEPESRGQGVMRAMMAELMRQAQRRGAVISTLFPTVPALYRRFGYATIATTHLLQLPTWSLRGLTGEGSLRRATQDDFGLIRELYTRWARDLDGPLTREGVSFEIDPKELFAAWEVTIAYDPAGEPIGYSVWKRSGGYHHEGKVEIADLIALSADGYRLLCGQAGSFYAVAPTTEVVVCTGNTVPTLTLLLPELCWPVTQTEQYMVAILDVVEAIQARIYPEHLRCDVRFDVEGAFVEGVDGRYRLQIADGVARCARTEVDAQQLPTFSATGLALWFSGAQPGQQLIGLGELRATRAQADELTSIFAGRQIQIADNF